MTAVDGSTTRGLPRLAEVVAGNGRGRAGDRRLCPLPLAPSYDLNAAAISEGTLFRVEAAAAVVSALLVLFVRGRLVALLAFLAAAGGVAAVLLFSYVNFGAIGPFPNMYEPVFDPEKTLSLIGEAVAAVAALLLLLSRSRGTGRQPTS